MQQSAVLLAFWREIQPTDVCKANVLKSSYRKRFEQYFNWLDEEQA